MWQKSRRRNGQCVSSSWLRECIGMPRSIIFGNAKKKSPICIHMKFFSHFGRVLAKQQRLCENRRRARDRYRGSLTYTIHSMPKDCMYDWWLPHFVFRKETQNQQRWFDSLTRVTAEACCCCFYDTIMLIFIDWIENLPCCCMHRRNLTTTFDEGLIRTCRRPRFSAFEIVLRQSAKTDIRTICVVCCCCCNGEKGEQRRRQGGRGEYVWELDGDTTLFVHALCALPLRFPKLNKILIQSTSSSSSAWPSELGSCTTTTITTFAVDNVQLTKQNLASFLTLFVCFCWSWFDLTVWVELLFLFSKASK